MAEVIPQVILVSSLIDYDRHFKHSCLRVLLNIRCRTLLVEKQESLRSWHHKIPPYIGRHLSIKSFVEDSVSPLLHILSPPSLRPVCLHLLAVDFSLYSLYPLRFTVPPFINHCCSSKENILLFSSGGITFAIR